MEVGLILDLHVNAVPRDICCREVHLPTSLVDTPRGSSKVEGYLVTGHGLVFNKELCFVLLPATTGDDFYFCHNVDLRELNVVDLTIRINWNGDVVAALVGSSGAKANAKLPYVLIVSTEWKHGTGHATRHLPVVVVKTLLST